MPRLAPAGPAAEAAAGGGAGWVRTDPDGQARSSTPLDSSTVTAPLKSKAGLNTYTNVRMVGFTIGHHTKSASGHTLSVARLGSQGAEGSDVGHGISSVLTEGPVGYAGRAPPERG